ncbi:MAG: YgiQ family radical SAM protein, partial [Phycisphaerales bacterium]|nr:YgiQ family radical SAM protein [Phycisphaerales bacterium]
MIVENHDVALRGDGAASSGLVGGAHPTAAHAQSSVALALPQFEFRRTPPLPMTRGEMLERGWDSVDIVFVTGDAYVDHPAFAAGILCRVLEAHGFRVGVLAQPDWKSCEPWTEFGKPNLFFAISAGNMDSMLNHYTASRKVRNDDAYSPGGRIGLRPDRATKPYCQRAREAYKGVPIIAGGVEASLRRLAHYDYWSDKVMRSILLDAKADLIAYGMGEDAIVEIAQRLREGADVKDLRSLRGVAYPLGASEEPPTGDDVVALPSYEEIRDSKQKFAEATRLYHLETNPYNAKTLVQYHDRQAVVITPPRLPADHAHMDFYYDLPYTRRPHPRYTERIPAYEVVKDSVTIMRGCFGGCTFCSITMHQGRIIQSRSKDSIIGEVKRLGEDDEFKGIISDIGGPT